MKKSKKEIFKIKRYNKCLLFLYNIVLISILISFIGCCSKYKKSDVTKISSSDKCWTPYFQNQKIIFKNITSNAFDTLTISAFDTQIENACAECYCNEERLTMQSKSNNGIFLKSLLTPDHLEIIMSENNHYILQATYPLNSNTSNYNSQLVKLDSVIVNGITYKNVLFASTSDNKNSIYICYNIGIIKYKFNFTDFEIIP
jgi:hypothetical protein